MSDKQKFEQLEAFIRLSVHAEDPVAYRPGRSRRGRLHLHPQRHEGRDRPQGRLTNRSKRMSSTNRINSACWYRPANYKQPGGWLPGTLRAWGTDFDEPGGSGKYAQFPVGVVEDSATGLCHSIYVTRICFAAVPPSA